MPAVRPQVLVDAILDAINQSGGSGLILSPIRSHPRKFAVSGPDGDMVVWIYAWTLTPGGRPQLRNEYRIQMTTVASPLTLNPKGQTILLGFEPNLNIFAGFDIHLHRQFTSGSPSVQVNINSLRQALQNGLAFHHKRENDEITVAIRPDHFVTYVRNSDKLHKTGKHHTALNLLNKASSLEPITKEEINQLSKERRRLVHTVRKMSRDANFREKVLNAYSHRCAITRMQLRLVEAAHILPVVAPNSADETCNGLALSPTYHRAFDSGLIFMDTDYVVKINPKKEAQIKSLNLADGLVDFKASLGKIYLPPDKTLWPHPDYIKLANKYRGVVA